MEITKETLLARGRVMSASLRLLQHQLDEICILAKLGMIEPSDAYQEILSLSPFCELFKDAAE